MVTCASDQPAANKWGVPTAPPRGQQLPGVAHRTREKTSLTRSPVYSKRIQFGNSRVEGMQGQGVWGGACSSRPLPALPRAHQCLRSGFQGSHNTHTQTHTHARTQLIKSSVLAGGATSRHPDTGWGLWLPALLCLISIHSGAVEKDLLWKTKPNPTLTQSLRK